MTQLIELVARLEAAEKGSDELSMRVVAALLAGDGAYVEQSPINGKWCIYSGTDRRGQPRLVEFSSANGLYRPGGWNVTESMDAALALVTQKLPGWNWRSGSETVDGLAIMLAGKGPTPPLALMIALVKALMEHPQ